MLGGGGNDTYFVDSMGDRVFEKLAGGTERVHSFVHHLLPENVENLLLVGSANRNGIGNNLSNSITGNSGNNWIDGQLANDVLAGGSGKENFLFTTAPGLDNIDAITDFVVADDTMRLDDSVFAGLAIGYLSAAAFHIGASAADAAHRVIYDSVSGAVLLRRRRLRQRHSGAIREPDKWVGPHKHRFLRVLNRA